MGYTITQLKAAGYSDSEIINSGYTASQLRVEGGYSLIQIIGGGYNASQLKDAGYYYYELLEAGFTPAELLEAGFIGFPRCLTSLFRTGYKNEVVKQGQCQPQALPLSKTTGSSSNSLNTSTNDTQISCRMRFSQQVQTYGTTKQATSYSKKTCRIGGPTFSY